jgi:8-oxo-dGTP diphosphatase
MGLIKVGVSAAVVRDGKILMGLRAGSFGADTWSIPGGCLELGEEPAEAAIRELLEETGLTAYRADPIRWTSEAFVHNDDHWITLHHRVHAYGEPRVTEPDKFTHVGWFAEPPQPLFAPFQNLLRTGWSWDL